MVTISTLPKQPLISHLVANPPGGCSIKLAKWLQVAPRNNCCPIVIRPVYHIEEGLVPDSYCRVGSIAKLSNAYA